MTLTRSRSRPLVEYARSYAEAGWPVLPLVPREKRPLTKHGLLDASTDPATVEAWWAHDPEANIGLRTGVAFDVIDLDGPEAIQSLHASEREIAGTGPVSTTGKGWHYLVQVTGARNGANLLPKVDFRGQNGYIVAPPSIHPSGLQYRWVRDTSHPLPLAPDWLLELLWQPPVMRTSKELSPTFASALDKLDLRVELERLGCRFVQRGPRLHASCPFHDDSTPSLVVYPNETFFCFGCNAWGDALNVVHYARHGTLR